MAKVKAADKGASSHITDIDHEPINSEQAAEQETDNEFSEFEQETVVETIPLEQRISTEIAKYNLADAAIATIKKKCSPLKITGPDDKKGAKKVKEAWQHVRKIRLAVSKKHEVIKADYLAITRAIDGEKNRLTDQLKPIEEALKNKLDAHDNEVQEIKNRAAKELEDRLTARVVELEANGVKFNGSFYAIGESISLDVVTLKELDADKYADLLTKVKAENERLIAAENERQENERKEQERQEQIRQDNEKKQKELEEQQKKLQEQMANMIKQRTALRGKELEGLGMNFVYTAQSWVFENTIAAYEITKADVDVAEDQDWTAKVEVTSTLIKKAKDQQAERDEAAQREKDRQALVDKLIADRTKELNELGLFQDGARFERKSQYSKVAAVFIGVDILQFDGLQYATNLAQLKEQVKEQQAQEVIEAQKPIMIKARLQQLRDLFGLVEGDGDYIRISTYPTVANMQVDAGEVEDKTEEEWSQYIELLKDQYKNILELEKEQKIIADQQAEAKRKAGLSDKQLIMEYLEAVAAIKKPELSTPYMINCFSDYEDQCKKAADELILELPASS